MLCRDMGSIDAFRLGDVRTIQNVRASPADWGNGGTTQRAAAAPRGHPGAAERVTDCHGFGRCQMGWRAESGLGVGWRWKVGRMDPGRQDDLRRLAGMVQVRKAEESPKKSAA